MNKLWLVFKSKPTVVADPVKPWNFSIIPPSANFNPPVKVIEQSNHFRFKGKLCDYEEYKEQEDKGQKSKNEPVLDYANYKNLWEKKDN